MIRAINQRWLINFWNRHQGNAALPPWQAIEAEDLKRVADNLSFLTVTGEGDMKRFQVLKHGPGVAKVYGAPDCSGRFLDDVIPRLRHPTGLMPYYRAFSSSTPRYGTK